MTAAAGPSIARRRGSARHLVAGALGAALALGTVVAVTRNDGYPQRDVRVFAGTRWLVDREAGAIVLADAASGRATARIVVPERAGNLLDTVQSDRGAFLVDRDAGEIIAIDQKGVKLADSRRVDQLDDTRTWLLGAGEPGAVAASTDGTAVTVPESGEATIEELPTASLARLISLDGAIWTHGLAGQIDRTTAGGTRQVQAGVGDTSLLGSVGDEAVVLDRDDDILEWVLTDDVVTLPLGLELADAVVQSPGPEAPCAWLGAADQLVCVSREAVTTQLRLTSFTFRAGDRLLVSAGVVAVVRLDGSVVRIDPESGTVTPVTGLDWTAETRPTVAADDVVIWIDDPDGPSAIAITARSTRIIAKRDEGAAEFDAEGVPTMASTGGTAVLQTAEAEGSTIASSGRPRPPDENGLDDPPIAVNDHASVRRGASVTVAVTANDHDPDGGPVALVDVTPAAHGAARRLNATSVVYTAADDNFAEDSFSYTIVDSTGNSATATVTVDILPPDAPNAAPIAGNDEASTSPGRSVTVDVLANDTDPDGDPLVIGSPSLDPSLGRVEVTTNVGGRPELRITPAGGVAGRQLRVTYRAVDTAGAASGDATLVIRVAAGDEGNRPPVAIPDAAQVIAGESVVIAVLDNDLDDDNDVLAIDSISLDRRDGSATIDGGNVVFRAPANIARQVVFTYVVSDTSGESSTGTVLVNVVPAGDENQAPVAMPDVKTAGLGRNAFQPMENDVDPDGDPLVITGVSLRSGRTATVWHDGRRVFFEPTATGVQTAVLEYTISDGNRSSSSTITVAIRNARDPQGPVANADNVTAEPGVTKFIDVLENDTDPNDDPLTVEITGGCRGAECVVLPDQRIRFTAPADSSVTQYLVTYRVTNTVAQFDDAVLRISVAARTNGSLGPVVDDEQETMVSGTPEFFDVLANDYDPDDRDAPLTLKSVDNNSPPFDASIVDNQLRVSVPAGITAAGSFDYVVADADGQTGIGKIVINAEPPSNRPPVALPGRTTLNAGASTEFDFLSLVDDPDSPRSSLSVVGRPVVNDGSLLTVTNGSNSSTFRLTARAGVSGTATLTFQVTDGTTRVTGTLEVVIEPIANRAPVAKDDLIDARAGESVRSDVIANDDDLDGDPLTARIVTEPATSVGTVVADGRFVRFTPRVGFEGPATFTYVAVDSTGKTSNTAQVTIRVAACTSARPQAVDRPNEFTPYERPLPLELGLAPGEILVIDEVVGGRISKQSGGRIEFTPSAGNSTSGTIRYTVSNSCGQTSSALITIDVNRAPRLEPLTRTAVVGVPIDIPVSAFASDEEAVTLVRASGAGGAVTLLDRGTGLRFVPSGPAGQRVTISVTVTDAGGLEASGTIAIDVVSSVNAVPVAADDRADLEPGVTAVLDLLRNDVDADHPTSSLTIRLGTTVVPLDRGGSVTLSLSPGLDRVIASPSADAHGRGSFTYTVADPAGGVSSAATVSLRVNRPPLPVALQLEIAAGSTVTLTAYAPGVPPDVDGDEIVSDVLERSDPRVSVNFLPGLLITITVPADVPPGLVTVIYSIVDGLGAQSTGRLSITVTGGPSTTPAAPAPTAPLPTDTVAPSVGPEPPTTDGPPTS